MGHFCGISLEGHRTLLVKRSFCHRVYEATRKEEEAKAKQDEAVRQEQRRKAYSEAQRREADRVGTILEKQQAKNKALAELGKKREHESDLKSLKHQLDLGNKRDKVKPLQNLSYMSPCM